jgi:hypothetical protein
MVCLEALAAGAAVVSFTRPMKQPIRKWFHVKDKTEMIGKLKELLRRPLILIR